MERRDNYLIQRDQAKAYFMGFDQKEIIARWNLKADASYLYVTFLNQEYRIDRENGRVEFYKEGTQDIYEAGFSEVLSIFDLLCHAKEAPKASDIWAPVNSLKGRPRTVGVQESRSGKEADLFDRDVEMFKRACMELGGTEVSIGDIGFEFIVYQDLKVRLKFYRADDEFAAQIILLWPDNALEYMYYETTFYVLGFLIQRIAGKMKQEEKR